MSLIIDRPSQMPLARRIGWGGVTIVFWMIWVYLWQPFITLVAWWLGYQQASVQFVWTRDTEELRRLIVVYAAIVVAIGGVLLLWARIEYLRFRGVSRRSAPVDASLDELAIYTGCPVADMGDWQEARCLVASHDEHGRLLGAEVKR